MERNDKNGLGIFDDFNIAGIEKDLGMILSGSGEPDKKTEEDEKKKPKTNLPVMDFSTKIQVPETEEERKLLDNDLVVAEEDEGETMDSEEKEETDDESDEKGEEDAEITEDSPLYLHAATLHEEGILPTLDLENLKGKKYTEALQFILDKQKEYIENGRDEYKNSLTDRQKEFLEMIDKGIPEEDVEQQFRIEDSYGKITDQILSDDEELQEQIIIQNLKLKGLSDKKIKIFVDASKDKETLFEDSKEAKDEINAYIANQKENMIREAEERERQAEEREKELEKSIKTTIDSLTEILPGIKISAKEKTELYDLMTKPVEIRNINGQKVPISIIGKEREIDPINFNLKLIYYIKQGLFKKDFDLSKINNKLKSSAATKLAQKLKEDIGGPSGKGLTIEKKKEKNVPEKIVFPKF